MASFTTCAEASPSNSAIPSRRDRAERDDEHGVQRHPEHGLDDGAEHQHPDPEQRLGVGLPRRAERDAGEQRTRLRRGPGGECDVASAVVRCVAR